MTLHGAVLPHGRRLNMPKGKWQEWQEWRKKNPEWWEWWLKLRYGQQGDTP